MKIEEAIAKLVDAIRLRHLSYRTERCYVDWVKRFARFVTERCPVGSPACKMERFLTQLARQGVSASTQNQAFNAVIFFYKYALRVEVGPVKALRAQRPIQLRYAPEQQEVLKLLEAIEDVGGYPMGLIVRLIYGCGLRVNEPLNLRMKDVLIRESKLVIRSAKGGKDRVVPLPCSLVRPLQVQLAAARAVAERDRLDQVPVALPGLLARKYPAWQFSPKWAWVFPQHQRCKHPRSGETVRWHCLDVNVQRAVKRAATPLGLDVTPHHLRHAYATHALNMGQNPRAIQQAMGHSNLETTMGYLHAEAMGVRSPIECVGAGIAPGPGKDEVGA